MIVVAEEAAAYPEATEKDARGAGVLGEDGVDFLQNAQGAQAHVLEVPNRSRDDIECAHSGYKEYPI